MAPIKFVDGGEITVKNLTVVLSGQPGVGKTTLALTAAKPILIDFNAGIHRAANREGKAIVQVADWRDAESINRADVGDFKTIIVDTVGSALDILAREIRRKNPKTRKAGGGLTQTGYGMLKSGFVEWLTDLRSFDKDVILVAHGKEEQRGDETVDRLMVTGGSKDEIYQAADLMGRINIMDGMRNLTFDPTQFSMGKNVGIEDMQVTDPSKSPNILADIVQRAKVLINDESDKHKEEYRRVQDTRDWIEGLEATPDVFNKEIGRMRDADAAAVDRAMLVEAGAKKGLIFDKEAKAFSVSAAPAGDTKQATF